jgi:pyruvyltransferase
MIDNLHKAAAKLNGYKNKGIQNIITLKAAWTGKTTYFLKYASSPGFFRPRNVGDALPPYIYEHLSGYKAPPQLPMSNPQGLANYMTVGSILQFADEHTIVWGSGFSGKTSVFGCQTWEEDEKGLILNNVKPKKVCAVRGPLTRKRVLDLGVECPDVFGDPGILMPLLYRPSNQEKTTVLGIIPHFSHLKSPCFDKLSLEKGVKIISVYQDPERFIDELVQCEYIASSSLHGLILADAYDIPSLWILPSEYLYNTTFKYMDYLESVESEQKERLVIDSQITVKDIMSKFPIIKTKINPLPLLESCPFVDQNKITTLLKSQ